MAERARLQRQISSDVAHAQRALGEDCSTEEAVATIVRQQQRLKKLLMMRGPRATIVRSAAQVAAQKATDAARPKGDHRSAAQVAAQKAADSARPKGDDASGLVHHIIIPTDRITRTKLPLKILPLHIYSMTSKMKGNRPVLCWGQEPWTGASSG